MRLGLWAARASAARPCCPSQGRPLRLVRSRLVSAGAWPASTRWCCACCGGSRSRPSPGSSACRSGNWRVGGRALSPGSRLGCASAPRIPLRASWPRPIGGSVSSPGRASCSAPASSAPALWPAGGRADGRRELPRDRRGPRRTTGVCPPGDAPLPPLHPPDRLPGAHPRPAGPGPAPGALSRGRRRGPGPVVDDAGLLDAIRHDLDRSPFSGEGHRKVWARLRALDGLRAGRDRVLRLMRENALLSPHRGPQRPVNDHAGRITTDAPGVMWGTDAAVIPPVEDGNIALFVVVEHWNAEALGWHVAEKADRFAAAQALDLAIHPACGAGRADAARGLLLRHDHGSAFMSDHFQNQIAFLGMTPSFAFVREPETNGVAERFIRTLKEQVVWGRIFRNAEEVRAAVRAFVARYNEPWLLEKNAYRSPAQTRREWFAARAPIRAAA